MNLPFRDEELQIRNTRATKLFLTINAHSDGMKE